MYQNTQPGYFIFHIISWKVINWDIFVVHSILGNVKSGLSNSFANRHMWRMTYFPNISKLSCFEQNLGQYLEFPILIYTFLLYPKLVRKQLGADVNFWKFPVFFVTRRWTWQAASELFLSYGQNVFIRHIFGKLKKLLDIDALNGNIKG